MLKGTDEKNTSQIIPVTITFLSQSTPPLKPFPPRPACQTALLRAHNIPLHFYRYIYNQVGTPYFWASRRHLSDLSLSTIIHDTDVHIFIFYKDGRPCGFGELDGREAGALEVKFFGLFKEDIGQGLGHWFFANLLDAAWQLTPKLIKIETCTADHPAALQLYQKLGFNVYKQAPGKIKWQK